ncbi:transposase [Streptomyces murinus]|uniref:transposase n=1 Tax=Streptomyces murinus TaxID=33900 RepID=UPI003F476841
MRADERAEIIESIPSADPTLNAEFSAIVGNLSGFRNVGRLVSHAGPDLAPRDFGRRTGNFHRPKRYDQRPH